LLFEKHFYWNTGVVLLVVSNVRVIWIELSNFGANEDFITRSQQQ
jgi:hypothetical protein